MVQEQSPLAPGISQGLEIGFFVIESTHIVEITVEESFVNVLKIG
jgi:hypothetical protein